MHAIEIVNILNQMAMERLVGIDIPNRSQHKRKKRYAKGLQIRLSRRKVSQLDLNKNITQHSRKYFFDQAPHIVLTNAIVCIWQTWLCMKQAQGRVGAEFIRGEKIERNTQYTILLLYSFERMDIVITRLKMARQKIQIYEESCSTMCQISKYPSWNI